MQLITKKEIVIILVCIIIIVILPVLLAILGLSILDRDNSESYANYSDKTTKEDNIDKVEYDRSEPALKRALDKIDYLRSESDEYALYDDFGADYMVQLFGDISYVVVNDYKYYENGYGTINKLFLISSNSKPKLLSEFSSSKNGDRLGKFTLSDDKKNLMLETGDGDICFYYLGNFIFDIDTAEDGEYYYYEQGDDCVDNYLEFSNHAEEKFYINTRILGNCSEGDSVEIVGLDAKSDSREYSYNFDEKIEAKCVSGYEFFDYDKFIFFKDIFFEDGTLNFLVEIQDIVFEENETYGNYSPELILSIPIKFNFITGFE